MSIETLKLTFTGLCALLIDGMEENQISKSLQVFLPVTHNGGGSEMPPHAPRLSFRGMDLVGCFLVSNNQEVNPALEVIVSPGGEEIVNLPLPSRAQVSIDWRGQPALENSYDWDLPDLRLVPNLRELGITAFHADGTGAVAWIKALPFGRLSSAATINERGVPVRWELNGIDRFIANQTTVTSTAALGATLHLTVADVEYVFFSSDLSPLHLALTNLPQVSDLVQEPVPDGYEAHHMYWYEGVAKTHTGLKVPKKKGLGVTRQSTICPSGRFHTKV